MKKKSEEKILAAEEQVPGVGPKVSGRSSSKEERRDSKEQSAKNEQ
jgi:hypothetical protein